MAQYPYYLAIGMPGAEYWDGDAAFAKSWREADRLRQERENTMAWMQGMYVYDAIQRNAPILVAFPKKGAKAEPYLAEPYPITKREREAAQERQEKAKAESIKARFEAFAQRHNRKMGNG